MATTSTSALFTRSWVLSNASGTPKRLPAASADSRRLVDSAVISKSSASDLNAGMCACAAQPRSGLAPMIPTRILFVPPRFMAPPYTAKCKYSIVRLLRMQIPSISEVAGLFDRLVAHELPGGRGLDAWDSFLRAHATLVRRLELELAEATGLALADFDVLAQLARAGG